MRRITRREWLSGSLRWAAAAALAPALTSCSRIQRARTNAHDSSVTVLYPYDELVFGPDGDMPAKFLVFMPLFALNRRGELEGRLAESWEHSPDYRSWTIRLRHGVRWHDGVPVTAQDVKCYYDVYSAFASYSSLDAPLSLNVLDDLTYSITFHRQSQWFGNSGLNYFGTCLPKHVVKNLDPRECGGWDFWTHPVGNGPYRHHRTVPKTFMEFRANPDYYWGKPKIERVVLKLAGDTMTGAVPELVSGGVDAVPYLNRADVLALAGDPRFRAYNQLGDGLPSVLFWNHRNELFRDPNVRRALTLGINRRELLQVLNLPPDTPVLDSLCSDRQMRRREFPEAFPYDPVRASHLLDDAGWQKRNPEGLRERSGRPFTFTALLTNRPFDPGPNAAIYVQAQLKRLGIKMNLDPTPSAMAYPRVNAGDYQAAFHIMPHSWEPDTRPWGVERFLHAAGYKTPRFAELANRFRATFDPDEEDRLYGELATLFREELPATFLYPDVWTTVASRRIRGLEDAAYRGDLTWCMDQLWLEGLS